MQISGKHWGRSLAFGTATLVLVLLCAQCAKQTEMPITTRSGEARDLFVQARVEGENLHLDTAVVWTDNDAFDTDPKIEISELERISDRILFGSDYPNIPYAYNEAVESIMRLGLSQVAREKIFYKNASLVFGLR